MWFLHLLRFSLVIAVACHRSEYAALREGAGTVKRVADVIEQVAASYRESRSGLRLASSCLCVVPAMHSVSLFVCGSLASVRIPRVSWAPIGAAQDYVSGLQGMAWTPPEVGLPFCI